MKVNMLEIKTCHSIVTADMPAHRPYFIKDSIWPQEKIKKHSYGGNYFPFSS